MVAGVFDAGVAGIRTDSGRALCSTRTPGHRRAADKGSAPGHYSTAGAPARREVIRKPGPCPRAAGYLAACWAASSQGGGVLADGVGLEYMIGAVICVFS